MPAVLPCARNTRCRLPSVPSCKAIHTAKGFPVVCWKLLTQVSQLDLSITVDTSLTQYTLGQLEDAPAPGHRLLMLPLLLHSGPHCQVETHQSRSVHHHCVTYRLAVRDAGFPGATGFLLQCQYTSSNTPAYCTPEWHHGSTLHIGLQGSQEDPLARCQWRVVLPCAAEGSSPVHLSSAVQGTVHHFAVFHWSPHQRGSQPHSTACYEMATVFLHPVEPQALLPSGYPATPLLMWSLRLLSLLGILATTPIYCSSSCS